MRELIRPWKLITFAIGMAWLIWGALTLNIPDWDAGDSLMMGVLAYLTAPWSVRVFIQRRYLWWPLALFWFWLTVDGSYVEYNGLAGHEIYREANFYASSCLYLLCGFIWLHRGPLKTILIKRQVVF